MRRHLAALAVAVTASLVTAVGAVPAHADTEPLPVTYNFLLGAIQAGADNLPDAPGSNIWTCKPTAEHPRPVILVHGTAGAQDTNWMTYAPLLKNNGYCVFALTYGTQPGLPLFGGMKRIEESAAQFADFVARVLAATGASQVDLIGHSQGTLMPNYYLKFLGGASHVKRYISLSSLWHGSSVVPGSGLLRALPGYDETATPICNACGQFAAGSDFITNLRAGGVAVPGVDYTNIVTRYDQLVVPYTSGIEPGMRNIVLQDRCALDLSDHVAIASSPNAAGIVLNTLDPEHPRPVPCRLVLPVFGPLV